MISNKADAPAQLTLRTPRTDTPFYVPTLLPLNSYKFRMFGVISSYREFFASKASKLERTGFQPVEFLPCKRPKVERTDK
jgi:hypothetical protein